MDGLFVIFIFAMIGSLLLYFGYTFLRRKPSRRLASPRAEGQGLAAPEGQTCLVCGALLTGHELMVSKLSGRVMHVKGCRHCLRGGQSRRCPVCQDELKADETVVCRLDEKPNALAPVSVLGCTRCLSSTPIQRWLRRLWRRRP